jgi:hypothetical protein
MCIYLLMLHPVYLYPYCLFPDHASEQIPKDSLKIPREKSEETNRRRRDNAMDKRRTNNDIQNKTQKTKDQVTRPH